MDDRNERNSPDSKRINVNEEHEVRYWTKELGVSVERLHELVATVGTSAAAVKAHLGK